MIRERLSNVWGIATDTQLIIVGRKGRCAVASAIACSRPVIHDNVIAIVIAVVIVTHTLRLYGSLFSHDLYDPKSPRLKRFVLALSRVYKD